MTNCERCGRYLADVDDFDAAEATEVEHGRVSDQYKRFEEMCWSAFGDCTGDEIDWQAQLATERTRREQAERERDALFRLGGGSIRLTETERDAATWAAFVHALRVELAEATIGEMNAARMRPDVVFSRGYKAGREETEASMESHWRTQAAAMEQARDQAQAAELRALKNVERLTKELTIERQWYAVATENVEKLQAELQAARMPDEVREVVRDALERYRVDYRKAEAAIAWIDGLGAGKDVK